MQSESKASVPGREVELPQLTGKLNFTERQAAIRLADEIVDDETYDISARVIERESQLAEERKEIEHLKGLLQRARPLVACVMGCDCEGDRLNSEIIAILAPTATERSKL